MRTVIQLVAASVCTAILLAAVPLAITPLAAAPGRSVHHRAAFRDPALRYPGPGLPSPNVNNIPKPLPAPAAPVVTAPPAQGFAPPGTPSVFQGPTGVHF
jgi:hypothetical protein